MTSKNSKRRKKFYILMCNFDIYILIFELLYGLCELGGED